MTEESEGEKPEANTESGVEENTIRVNIGDRLIKVEGFRISLNRKQSTGWLTRRGLSWFVHTLYMLSYPKTEDDIESTLETYWNESNKILEKLVPITGLTDEEASAAIERIKGVDSVAGWALSTLSAVQDVSEAIEQGDAKRVAWTMYHLVYSRAMLLFKRELEENLWRGYVLSEDLALALQLWEQHKSGCNEDFWQKTLRQYSFILSQVFATPAVIIQDKAYVGGTSFDRSGSGFLDYLVTNSLTKNTTLIEIKTPCTKLLGAEYRTGVWSPSTELSGAVIQVSNYKDSLSKEYSTLINNLRTKTPKDEFELFEAFNSACLVIAGDTAQLKTPDQVKSFELFRSSLRDVQVITFDELFGKIKMLLDLLDKVTPVDPDKTKQTLDHIIEKYPDEPSNKE